MCKNSYAYVVHDRVDGLIQRVAQMQQYQVVKNKPTRLWSWSVVRMTIASATFHRGVLLHNG
jgi:hypothetical protein